MDAVLLGYLLKVAFDGIVGTQVNDGLKHLCLKALFEGSKKVITKR